NFINGELYGRVTTVPWGMVFPEGGPLPRHPSQLYEGLLEGLILFLLLFFLRKKVSYRGLIFSFFILGYAIFRFIVEFFREADEQVGYFFSEYITMGQILCFIMLMAGLFFLKYFLKRKIPMTPLRFNKTEDHKDKKQGPTQKK
ncbi:MAG: prolipoprotein diacylglyceryl transferase, partial [Bacteriovoracaceae bacterium]|nr:prolipoprotein diacylglyceryl transferase [Bacteriovoracaceae bacterium]